MRIKTMLAFLLVLALATAVGAQTKVSGSGQCGKPDPQHTIPVGDRPNHSFMLSQSKCTWTKPFEIAGIQSKEGLDTAFDEITGDRSRRRGFYLDTMTNGDKAHYRYEATATMKEGMLQSSELKWSLVGGTGKLKGIKGKGTCKIKGAADGTSNYECEGEYELPK